MDALDEETKENILRNIGELFPNVSDLSFFRQVFDNENWDLEKSLVTIKDLLEYVDEEGCENDAPHNSNARVPSPTPGLSNVRIRPNPAQYSNPLPTSGSSDSLSGFSSARNSAPTSSKMLYSSSFVKAGAVPKTAANEKKVTPASKNQRREKLLKAYNDGLKQKNPVLRIKSLALEGIKVMVIMRGCPGSGKTYLVQHLANSLSLEQSKALDWTVAHPVDHHIFSADDFWINPAGKYVFNSEYIEYAHRWNQKLVRQAASEGRSPIFVDNTHTRLWEMQAVATIAVEFGYIIEIIDSKDANKKWAFNVNELVRRNVHGVHYDAIKRMVERYELDIQPKHLFKTYNLKYQPNVTPPQRCLVTFSTPPSKNHMKIFNTRFHFAPINDILALKPAEPGGENSVKLGNKAKNAPRLDRGSIASDKDPRNPMIYSAAEFLMFKKNEAPVFRESDGMEPIRNRAPVGISESPQKEGPYSGTSPSRYTWTAPPSAPPTQDYFFGLNNRATNANQVAQESWSSGTQYPPSQNCDAQPLINPAKNIWSNPYRADNSPASNSADASVDLLLSLNDDIGDTSSRTLLPKQVPTRNAESAVDPRPGIPTYKSDSGSDLLMYFEEASQVTSKSSSFPTVSRFHSPEGELTANPQVSPCKEVDPEDGDTDDSDFSCEDIPLSSPSNACNEFGQKVTSEYVLVQPDGHLKFQNSQERLPVSLTEFVASSKFEKLKNKLAKSAGRSDSDSINKFMLPFLKKVSNVPMYSDDTLIFNGNRPPELESKSAIPSTSLGKSAGNGGNFDRHEGSSQMNSLGDDVQVPDRPNLPSVEHVPKPTHLENSNQTQISQTYDIMGITPREFVEKVWGKSLSYGSAEDKAKSETSASAEMVSPIVASTWSEPKEPEPLKMSRSDSPKGQRSQVERTSTKKCDRGTDANYFEILSKANTSDVLGNNDVILFGNANSFQSSTSPPKLDAIKAVATHEKSSMTKGDESADEIESGVEILTKMFPDVSADSLVDLFEKCQKNLYWTANLLMDSGEEISEHFNADVAPRKESPPPSPPPQPVETASEPSSKESLTAPSSLKKLKKNRYKLTEEYSDLVKEFEGNFILNEEHYSDTLKKVRETKFGRSAEPVEDPCTSRDSTPPNDPESGSSDIWEDDEGDMSLVVSNDLIGQLQNKFGPIPNIFGSELVVKLPVSLARQVYSYALDSICQQVEDEQNLFDLLIKEDEAFARKLQEESDDSRGAMSFQEIMDHEMALRAHEREQGHASAASSETFASRLSQQLLAERFPNMDPVTLQNVLDVTNHSLHEATNLLASAGHVPVDPAVQEAVRNAENEPSYTMSREESIEQANAYHEVAAKLNDMRQLYFRKAKESYNSGNHAVALFYRELFNWYSDQIKTSNAKAAKAMLHGNEGATTLDLHYLHVSEAVGVLDLFLDESIRQLNSRKMEIFIITGRGLHSMDGKSKLKPAIKQRLKQRGLKYGEINPGMLKTVITKSSTVSYKLNGCTGKRFDGKMFLVYGIPAQIA